MNIIKRTTIWALAATVALATAACGSSDDEGGGKQVASGEKTAVKLNLSLTPSAASSTVNNVWILQWDAAGNNKVCRKERYHDTSQPLEATLEAGAGVKVAVIAGVDDGTVYTLGTKYEDFCKKAYPNRIVSDDQVPYSGLQEVTIATEGQTIDLPLKWIAAKISFRVASSTAGYTLKSAQLKNVATPVYLLPEAAPAPTYSTGDIVLTDLDKAHTYYVAENLQGSESGIASEKDRITTKKATYVEVIATKEANNIRTTATFAAFYGNNDMDNFDVNRGNSYMHELTIDFDAVGDKRLSKIDTDASLNTQEPANCYILSPTETIPMAIPVSRVNEFWADHYKDTRYAIDDGKNDGAVRKWVAKVIWETEAGLIDIRTGEGTEPNGYVVIKPGAGGKSGNALIGLFDATSSTDIDPSASKALWSWHIWVTDYNPGGGTNGPIPTVSGDPGRTAVAGGSVHYFNSLSFNTPADGSQAVIMDRDLGAVKSDPENLKLSTGMFYQWGRKDPFYVLPPDDSDIPAAGYDIDEWAPNATDHILAKSEMAPVSLAKAVQNPQVFYLAESMQTLSYDWLQQDNDNNNLWRIETDKEKKTLFDPCPPGWRVPADTRTFNSLIPREAWEPASFDPTAVEENKAAGIVDEYGFYNQYPRQGVVCWDEVTDFFSNNSGRINCYNGKLFEYGSGQNLFLGTPMTSQKANSLWQHSMMGVDSKEGSFCLFQFSWPSYRTSGCSVRCVKE